MKVVFYSLISVNCFDWPQISNILSLQGFTIRLSIFLKFSLCFKFSKKLSLSILSVRSFLHLVFKLKDKLFLRNTYNCRLWTLRDTPGCKIYNTNIIHKTRYELSSRRPNHQNWFIYIFKGYSKSLDTQGYFVCEINLQQSNSRVMS